MQDVVQRGNTLLQTGGEREGSAQHTELSVLVYHFLKVSHAHAMCKRQLTEAVYVISPSDPMRRNNLWDVQMHFCIWRTHPKLIHEALYEYTRLQLRGRSLLKPRNLAQQLVVRSVMTKALTIVLIECCLLHGCKVAITTHGGHSLCQCLQEAMRLTEGQRHAIVLAYGAMMRELSSIFARHKSMLASLSTMPPAPSAKTNGVGQGADTDTSSVTTCPKL